MSSWPLSVDPGFPLADRIDFSSALIARAIAKPVYMIATHKTTGEATVIIAIAR